MTTTKKKIEDITETELHEEWARRLLEEANIQYGLEAENFHWKIIKGTDGITDLCHWTFEKGVHKLIGSFVFGKRYEDCVLALATGIGLNIHPFRHQIMALLNYTATVSHNDSMRNNLGELAVRGYAWNNLIGKVPREQVMMRLIKDFRIKENIDDLYKVFLKGKLVNSKGQHIL